MIRIALITSTLSLEHIRPVISSFSRRCEIVPYCYGPENSPADIYAQIQDAYDGFLFSGWLVYAMIAEETPVKGLYECFSPTEGDFYRTLFTALVSHPGIRLHQILTDKAGTEKGFTDVMPPEDRCYEVDLEGYFGDPSAFADPKHFLSGKRSVAELYLEEIHRHDIRIVVSGLALSSDELRELGVEYYHIYPGADSISAVIIKLIDRIESGNLMGMMSVNGLLSAEETDTAELEKLVSRFVLHNGIDCISTRTEEGLRLILSNPDFGRITFGQTDCSLSRELLNCEITDFWLGWGLGTDLTNAWKNARKALSTARRFGTGSTFIVHDNGSLTGPLLRTAPLSFHSGDKDGSLSMSYRYDISQFYVKCLRALIETSHNNVFTASALAKELNIHPRSARRLLSKLLSTGGAVLLEDAGSRRRGRPELCYRIELH